MEALMQSILDKLVCPYCRRPLMVSGDRASCAGCGCEYPPAKAGQMDLRLNREKKCSIEFSVGPENPLDVLEHVETIPSNPQPELNLATMPIPQALWHGNRLTSALLTHFPRAHHPAGGVAAVLDFGCGDQPFKPLCTRAGFEYVGIDHDGDALILADAHALPFKDEAFDFAISFAVLEHLRNPHIAVRELFRVLKPGSPFIGSVGFVEPFHLNSYFPMSPLGTWEILATSGFDIRYLEPNLNFDGLSALAEMSLFPHAPRSLAHLIALPMRVLHRLWWKLGYALQPRPGTSEKARRINNAGGFRFVCSKPGGAVQSRDANA
jgi:SAM-dependent methyltransferase/uncharacterized protein YbaR (Trm112 family)